MKLEQSFEVAAPLERVWEALTDIEHVAPCLPGAAVTGRNEDGTYNGTFSVKIGPTSASYTGKLAMDPVDASHTATMQAQGTDKRGQGGAKATIVSTLTTTPSGGTQVEVVTDYHITGRLARFGRGGMIEDISARLLRQFAKCLRASLAAEAPSTRQPEPAPEARSPPERELAAEVPLTSQPEPVADVPLTPQPEPVADVPLTPQPEPAKDPQPTPWPTAVAYTSPSPPQESIGAISLVSSVLWDRTRRNPRRAIALLLGLLLGISAIRRALR